MPLDPLFVIDLPPLVCFPPSAAKRVRVAPTMETEEDQENRDILIDMSPYFTMMQADAAERLGMGISTLSKRWKDAVGERIWPYRKVQLLDNRIKELERRPGKELELESLRQTRQEMLMPVMVYIGGNRRKKR